MKEFKYLAPEGLLEALSLASQYGSHMALLAGGTDLVVQMKHGVRSPSYLINLKKIPGLDCIRYDPLEGLSIGPLVTHNTLADHPIISRKFALLAEAAQTIGTFQIRERGTLGGNICNGSPAADTLPALFCLGARLKLQRAAGEDREVPIEAFFEGPQKTRRGPGEILTQILIPPLPHYTGSTYLKLGKRKAMEIAVLGVAAQVTLDQNRTTCLRARIALASVAPTPLSCIKAERVLVGQEIKDQLIEKAARTAQSEASPITDLRSTAEYRLQMVYTLTQRALKQAWQRAQGRSLEA